MKDAPSRFGTLRSYLSLRVAQVKFYCQLETINCYSYFLTEMKLLVFLDSMLHCKAILGWITWANEMNFVINHAPGAGSIAGFVGL